MRRCAVNFLSSASIPVIRSSRYHRLAFTPSHYAQRKSELDQGGRDLLEEQVALKATIEEDEASESQIYTSSRRVLPPSPLMDPAYLTAKEKHRKPKAPPSKILTPFQQQLAKDPYAQALATPVRMCSLTRTHLPSFFLQDFELIAHPETKEPWYMPRSLTTSRLSAISEKSQVIKAASVEANPVEATPNTTTPTSPTSPSPSSPTPPTPTPTLLKPDTPPPAPLPTTGTRAGPRVYTLSRLSLLHGTVTPQSGFTNGQERFPSQRNREQRAFRALNIQWRSDMGAFVLELMRKRVVERLAYANARGVGYLARRETWEGVVAASHQVAAVLWLRGREGGGAESGEGLGGFTEGEGEEEEGPREFAILDLDRVMRRKIPVYNLQVLLGDKHVNELRRHDPWIFGAQLVVLKNRRVTNDVLLLLWKLQGYVAKYEEVESAAGVSVAMDGTAADSTAVGSTVVDTV